MGEFWRSIGTYARPPRPRTWRLLWASSASRNAERPIRIGDYIEIGDARGRVEAINNRSTRIRRTDGVHLLVPNSALLETTVINWTLMDDVARSAVSVGVAYGSLVLQRR